MTMGIDEVVRTLLNSIQGVVLCEEDVIDDPPVDARGAPAAYVRFSVVGARPGAFALAKGGSVLRPGFVQIGVYVPESAGRDAAKGMGDLVVAHFPRLTRLGLAQVEQPAYASRLLQETPYNHVPVTVPYAARVRE